MSSVFITISQLLLIWAGITLQYKKKKLAYKNTIAIMGAGTTKGSLIPRSGPAIDLLCCKLFI